MKAVSQVVDNPDGLEQDDFMQQFPHHERFMHEPEAGKPDHEEGAGVPIVAAGGEYVLSPEQVRTIGNGDLDTGHRVLDKFVKDTRSQLIKTLQKLPGPKKD